MGWTVLGRITVAVRNMASTFTSSTIDTDVCSLDGRGVKLVKNPVHFRAIGPTIRYDLPETDNPSTTVNRSKWLIRSNGRQLKPTIRLRFERSAMQASRAPRAPLDGNARRASQDIQFGSFAQVDRTTELQSSLPTPTSDVCCGWAQLCAHLHTSPCYRFYRGSLIASQSSHFH